MNKVIFIIIGIAFIIAAVILGIRFLSGEDIWICRAGQWIKHGVPDNMPATSCGSENDIVVTSLKNGEKITSPVSITGKARGTWFFEASFPVKVIDSNGKELGVNPMQAQGDWMTEDFVNFSGTVQFINPTTDSGFVILQNDNPSGLAENAKYFTIPVKFGKTSETMTLKAYFNNNNLDPGISCNKVFPVERTVPKTSTVARAAIEELLKGPTEAEKLRGFATSINPGVKIQSLTIENETAKIDFDEQLEFQVGGSCKVAVIRAQIIQTLKQFSTVKDVIISISGRTEDILQP